MIPDPVGWFAMGALFGLALCGWPWHPRFSRYEHRRGSSGDGAPWPPAPPPPPEGWVNTPYGYRPPGDPLLAELTEGRVQRGNGNGGPSTAKPPIRPQPHGGRMVGPEP